MMEVLRREAPLQLQKRSDNRRTARLVAPAASTSASRRLVGDRLGDAVLSSSSGSLDPPILRPPATMVENARRHPLGFMQNKSITVPLEADDSE